MTFEAADFLPVRPDYPPSMDIRAVVTSVGYGDFLAYTLPTNKHVFNDMIVVTSPEDTTTRRVCEFWEVRCLVEKAFRDRGKFCKGAGINCGIWELHAPEWVLHMDADILLPAKAKTMVEAARPDPRCVFGIDRMNATGFDAWHRFLSNPRPQHERKTYVHHGSFPTGSRIAWDSEGWLPIGFFQLWHPLASGVGAYPEGSGGAARDDVKFSLRWPRERRAFLPELIAYHLESEPAAQGANWSGRKTRHFGPC
jgi:hypothetical protein